MKANINIPHCRGIPTTKLPNWAVRERFRKDYTNREEGKGEGKRKKEKEKRKGKRGRNGQGGKMVGWLSNDWQLLPPSSFRAKVQRSEVKARRKNCHEWANRPQAPPPSTHVYILPYVYTVCCTYTMETNPLCTTWEGSSGNLWMILLRLPHTYATSHRVIATFSKPDTGDPFFFSISLDWTMYRFLPPRFHFVSRSDDVKFYEAGKQSNS